VKISAELTTFVQGRRLDDDTHIRMHYANGAKGTLWASQVAVGNENALRIRVYGTKGGLSWSQENPNYLQFSPIGKPTFTITRGGAGSGAEAARMTRVPRDIQKGILKGSPIFIPKLPTQSTHRETAHSLMPPFHFQQSMTVSKD